MFYGGCLKLYSLSRERVFCHIFLRSAGRGEDLAKQKTVLVISKEKRILPIQISEGAGGGEGGERGNHSETLLSALSIMILDQNISLILI